MDPRARKTVWIIFLLAIVTIIVTILSLSPSYIFIVTTEVPQNSSLAKCHLLQPTEDLPRSCPEAENKYKSFTENMRINELEKALKHVRRDYRTLLKDTQRMELQNENLLKKLQLLQEGDVLHMKRLIKNLQRQVLSMEKKAKMYKRVLDNDEEDAQ